MIPSLGGIAFQRKTGKPMWKDRLDIYGFQWNFDRRRF
jgi:hypothetical protein